MKKDYIEIALVLDRSGSMDSLKQFAIKGFNDFITEQKNVLTGKNVLFSLILFDHEYITHIDRVNLQDIPELDTTVYVPRGMTALLDAIGKTIVDLGSSLDKMAEEDKPQKVIIAVMTDGQQNASKEYTVDGIKSLIATQRDVYNWDIIFMSSDLDAIGTAVSAYGIDVGATLCYMASKDGYDMNSKSSSFYGAGKYIYKAIYGQDKESTDGDSK